MTTLDPFSPHSRHVINTVPHGLHIGVLSLTYHVPACIPDLVPPPSGISVQASLLTLTAPIPIYCVNLSLTKTSQLPPKLFTLVRLWS